MPMLNREISVYIRAFNEKFGEFLTSPDINSVLPEDHVRAVISDMHMILPAQQKFSDWDIYCNVDPSKINLEVLNEMRAFVMGWKDFDLVRDYATCNPFHLAARAYQSVGIGKLHCVQFMGLIKDEDFAPFLDLHIIGVEQSMLEAFYAPICKLEDTGYLDWSILTFWRKFRRTGEMYKDRTTYQRSIYPALTQEQKECIDRDTKGFLKIYFKPTLEFDTAVSFLTSE